MSAQQDEIDHLRRAVEKVHELLKEEADKNKALHAEVMRLREILDNHDIDWELVARRESDALC